MNGANILTLITGLWLTSGALGGEIGVPVLLWQQRPLADTGDLSAGVLASGERASTVHQLDSGAFGDRYLPVGHTIVAFVQNRLSLEQFTADDRPESRLAAVRRLFTDVSVAPTLLTDVLNPTAALDSRHFRHVTVDSDTAATLTIQSGDKLWLELPGDSLTDNDQLIDALMVRIGANVSAVYVLTGAQNQFQSIDLEDPVLNEIDDKPLIVDKDSAERKRRVRRAADITEDDKKRLINVNDCLFMYTTGITVNQVGQKDPLVVFDPLKQDPATMVDKANTRCWKATGGKQEETGKLTLNYKNGTKSLTLALEINSYWYKTGLTNYWNIKYANVTYKSSDTATPDVYDMLAVGDITAEYNFGFSCTKLIIQSPSLDVTGAKVEKRIALTFSRFQLQPFTSKKIFTESFNCETWMTMPLWMGLLTLILLFTILFVGVYFVSIVNTPDRFENPKSKPLMINTSED